MDAKLEKELKDIRNLLILIALKLNATTDQVGNVLGVTRNAVSMLVPLRKKNKGKKG